VRILRKSGSTELARSQTWRDLGITRHTLCHQLGSFPVLGPVLEINLLDPFSELLIRVSGILEQRPHAIDDKDQAIDPVVKVEKVLHSRPGSIRRDGGKASRLRAVLTQYIAREER
jgi:hypothetical protein